MTKRELVALLERAQELGGPLHESPLSLRVFLTEDREHDYWSVLDPMAPQSHALLIHAFTLDAEKRGWNVSTELRARFAKTDPSGVWLATIWEDGDESEAEAAMAPTLLEAVLRAWIAVREDEET